MSWEHGLSSCLRKEYQSITMQNCTMDKRAGLRKWNWRAQPCVYRGNRKAICSQCLKAQRNDLRNDQTFGQIAWGLRKMNVCVTFFFFDMSLLWNWLQTIVIEETGRRCNSLPKNRSTHFSFDYLQYVVHIVVKWFYRLFQNKNVEKYLFLQLLYIAEAIDMKTLTEANTWPAPYSRVISEVLVLHHLKYVVAFVLDYRRKNQIYLAYLKHAIFLWNRHFIGCVLLIFSAYSLHVLFHRLLLLSVSQRGTQQWQRLVPVA